MSYGYIGTITVKQDRVINKNTCVKLRKGISRVHEAFVSKEKIELGNLEYM